MTWTKWLLTHQKKMQGLLLTLSFFLPAFFYLQTLFPTFNWPESAKIISGANQLDITNSPPNTLSWLLGWLTLQIPGSTDSIKLSLLNTLVASLGSAMFFLTVRATLRKTRTESLLWTGLIPLSFTLWFATTSQYTSVAIAPHHLPLTLLLFHGGLFYFLKTQTTFVPLQKPLLISAFLFGLTLTNHFPIGRIGFFMLAIGLASSFMMHGKKIFPRFIVATTFGLSPLLYLTLRANENLPVNLGAISGWKDLYWFFNSPLSIDPPNPHTEIFQPPTHILTHGTTFLIIVLATLFVWLLWKNKTPTKIITPWLITAICVGASLLFPNFFGTGSTPQQWVTLLYSPLVCFACIQTTNLKNGFSLPTIKKTRKQKKTGRVFLISICACLLWVPQTLSNQQRFGNHPAFSVQEIGDIVFKTLPKNAILISTRRDTTTLFWAWNSKNKKPLNRILISTFLLNRPSYIQHLLNQFPELKEFLQSYLIENKITLSKLSSLVSERPVFLEISEDHSQDWIKEIHPTKSIFFQFSGTSLTTDDLQLGAKENLTAWTNTMEHLGSEILNPATKNWVLAQLQITANYYFSMEQTQLAAQILSIGILIQPNYPPFLNLAESLSSP